MKINWKVIGGVAVAGVAAYLIIKSIRKSAKKSKFRLKSKEEEINTQDGMTVTDVITISDFSYPIKRGMKGENVKKLQLLILQFDKNLLPKSGADGDFGSETEKALKSIIGKKFIQSEKDIQAIKNAGMKKAANAVFNAQLFGGAGKDTIKIIK